MKCLKHVKNVAATGMKTCIFEKQPCCHTNNGASLLQFMNRCCGPWGHTAGTSYEEPHKPSAQVEAWK